MGGSARLGRTVGRLARSRWMPAGIGVSSLLLGLMLTAWLGIPGAESHDERSYLLAADTFVHGRLTNRPHPMWEHLETFHVLHQPTYMSKYPPGQGLILALGRVLTGEAIAGAWIVTALACAAIAWALRGWLPPRWALLGGLFAVTHALLIYWSQNYWGGSLAAVGGALVLGGIGRMRRRATVASGVWAGLGVAVLLMTRPYEGMLWTALLLPLVPWRRILRDWRAPVGGAVVLAAAGAWLGYYNWRVTGDALTPPYVLFEREYSEASPFVWMEPRATKTYRHAFLRYVYHDSELAIFNRQRTWEGYLDSAKGKLTQLGSTYFVPSVPAMGLIGLPWLLWRGRWSVRYVAAALVAFGAALTFTAWFFSHYAAPMFAGLLLVEMAGLRRVAANRVVRRVGLPVMVVVAAGLVVWWGQMRAGAGESWGQRRDAVVREVGRQPGGPHLVIVRYQYIHNLNRDWVANAADIDASPVVWARDMGSERNAELLRYFAGRKAWLMTVVGEDVVLEPYPMAR